MKKKVKVKKRSASTRKKTTTKRAKATPPEPEPTFVAPTHDRLGDVIIESVRRLLELNETLPDQRTPGWFAQRKTRMTASPVSSVLRLSQFEIDLRDNMEIDMKADKKPGHVMPSFNSYLDMLRTKCGLGKPFTGSVHTEWGVAYEPVITELYERIYDVVVHEFGMVPHPTLDWLGASPDGITSQGMMLEIKCPYQRIPKKNEKDEAMPKMQYWVQMQIQMECCGFDECDFVDVQLDEFGSRDDYLEDCYGVEEDGSLIYGRTRTGQPKGFMIEKRTFAEDGTVTNSYHYPPVLQFTCRADEDAWLAEWAEKHLIFTPNELVNIALHKLTTFHIRYWYVKQFLVKTVQRNVEWLKVRLPEIHDFWKLVLKCREDGIPDDASRPPAPLSTRSSSRSRSDPKQRTIDPKSTTLTSRNTSSFKRTTSNRTTSNKECMFWDSDED